MEDRKIKLLEKKDKLEARIKEEQAKLKLINQELENIEMREKADTIDLLIESLKGQGIENVDALIQLAKDGKINVGGSV